MKIAKHKKIIKFLMIVLWVAAIVCTASIYWREKSNQTVKFLGFSEKPIIQNFKFLEVKVSKKGWFAVEGKIKNAAEERLEVEKISVHIFNKNDQLILTKDHFLNVEKKTALNRGEEVSFNFKILEQACQSMAGMHELGCNNLVDFKNLAPDHFKADIHWQKEISPDANAGVLKTTNETSLISNIKIEELKQSYYINETAKLSYWIGGKKKEIYGDFSNTVKYGIKPEQKDVNNDGVQELILASGGNGSNGLNFIILSLDGDRLTPLNVATHIYDRFGDNVEKIYNDSGLRNLETGDYNEDGFIDLKGRDKTGEKIYYWNAKEELHIRKVMQGKN